MDKRTNERDASMLGDGVHDVRTLRAAYSDGRAVLDHQLETASEIDDKAAHTLRILLLIFGLIATGVSVAVRGAIESTPETQVRVTIAFLNVITVIGVVGLLSSMAFAIWAYSNTEMISGMKGERTWTLLRDRPTEQQLLLSWLEKYRYWTLLNEFSIARDATILFVCHLLLYVGIVLFVLGVVSGSVFGETLSSYLVPGVDVPETTRSQIIYEWGRKN